MDLIDLRRKLSLASIFCIPLKLSWTYIFLIPAILLLLREVFSAKQKDLSFLLNFSKPLLYFFATAAVSLFFALDSLASLYSLSKLFFLSLSLPLYYILFREYGYEKLFKLLFIAQTTAAVHSVLEQAAKPAINKWFIGAVSESGQLAMTCVLAAVIALSSQNKFLNLRMNFFKSKEFYLSAFLFYAALLYAFLAKDSFLYFSVLSLLFCLAFGVSLFYIFREKLNFDLGKVSLVFFVPLLFAGLFAELKRGPIVAVCVALSFFILSKYKRLFLPVLLTILVCFVSFPSLKNRFSDSWQHFFIRGGRYQMWSVGSELIGRYPFGLGYGSSSILKKFSRDIPAEHDHFHNNFLNILIETGWLPTLLLAYFIFKAIFSALLSSKSATSLACGLALLSSQLAGLVEYNLGDSEVTILFLLVLAGLAYSLEEER